MRKIIGQIQLVLGGVILVGFWVTLAVAEIGATMGQAILATLGCIIVIIWGIRNIRKSRRGTPNA